MRCCEHPVIEEPKQSTSNVLSSRNQFQFDSKNSFYSENSLRHYSRGLYIVI